jgi:hypothetical protein
MTENESAAAEARLTREIAEIDRTVSELLQRRRALESTILKLKREDLAAKEVTRKNSINRILVEKSILDQLQSGRFVSSRSLYMNAQASFYFLNNSTFRSYVRRMKERGLIESNRVGNWRLVPQQAKKPSTGQP